MPTVERRTPLREVLPLFVDDTDAPVAVVDEENRLEGVIVRGALIAGLTTTGAPDESGEDFNAAVGDRTGAEAGDRIGVHRAEE